MAFDRAALKQVLGLTNSVGYARGREVKAKNRKSAGNKDTYNTSNKRIEVKNLGRQAMQDREEFANIDKDFEVPNDLSDYQMDRDIEKEMDDAILSTTPEERAAVEIPAELQFELPDDVDLNALNSKKDAGEYTDKQELADYVEQRQAANEPPEEPPDSNILPDLEDLEPPPLDDNDAEQPPLEPPPLDDVEPSTTQPLVDDIDADIDSMNAYDNTQEAHDSMYNDVNQQLEDERRLQEAKQAEAKRKAKKAEQKVKNLERKENVKNVMRSVGWPTLGLFGQLLAGAGKVAGSGARAVGTIAGEGAKALGNIPSILDNTSDMQKSAFGNTSIGQFSDWARLLGQGAADSSKALSETGAIIPETIGGGTGSTLQDVSRHMQLDAMQSALVKRLQNYVHWAQSKGIDVNRPGFQHVLANLANTQGLQAVVAKRTGQNGRA